tara:strand:+ start:649 stop:756 length:108 start_codon:yes stop_codon:yes gene_type:complete
MNKRLKNITNSGSWIAIGAALGWRKPNNQKEKGNE